MVTITVPTTKGNIKVFYAPEMTTKTTMPYQKIQSPVFKHLVMVQLNGKNTSFDFHDSIKNTQDGKKMSRKDLGFALYCFIGDAIAGTMSLGDFESEFGYTKASECIRAYNGCKEATAKTESLGLTENDLYDLSNELSEKYG